MFLRFGSEALHFSSDAFAGRFLYRGIFCVFWWRGCCCCCCCCCFALALLWWSGGFRVLVVGVFAFASDVLVLGLSLRGS